MMRLVSVVVQSGLLTTWLLVDRFAGAKALK